MHLGWVSREYIAGFFDGEGSVHPYRRVKRGTCEVRVSIEQKRPEVLYEIRAFLGYGRVVRNGKSHSLRISGHLNCLKFLKLVRPYLIVKKQSAEIGIGFCQALRQGISKEEQKIFGDLLSQANRV